MLKVVSFAVCLLTTAWSAPVWLSTGTVPEPSPAQVTILSSNSSATEFEVEVPGVVSTPTAVSGATYARLSLPGEIFAVLGEGRPEVPKVSVLLGIPKGASVSVEVTAREVKTFPLANVYPQQPPQLDSRPAPPFTIDRSFYGRDVQYPGSDASLIETGVWRDLGVANIQVYPVQVNPGLGTVQVASRIRVRVEHRGSLPRTAADWMLPTYSRYIDNFAQLRLKPELDYTAGVRYLVIAHSNWSSNSLLVDSLLGWVEKRGYDVRLISKSSYTSQEVKDSINAEYTRHTPRLLRWVLLVGEFAEIPMRAQGGVGNGDYWYKDLEPWPAGDNYPEIGLARISPSSATDLQNQVRKILKYQKNPPATNNWLNRLTLVAHRELYPDKYSGCVRGIYNMPKPYWQPVVETIMGQYKNNADVTNAINAGVGILAYRGHGDVQEWWTWCGSSWYNSNIDALSNGDLTPVVYNIACCNGDLSVSECLSEKWMRKYPGGAVASLGATQASYTYPNHGICSTLVRATCDTWTITVPGVRNYTNPVFNLADIHMRLDAYVAKYWPGAPYPDNIYMYNMLGDPAMPVWAGGQPQTPTVTHPATIPLGAYTMNVNVQVGGRAVEGALVCAWKGTEFYIAERTNNLGNASLDVNATSGGTVLVTVSEGHAQHSTSGVLHTPILPYEGTATVGVTHDVSCNFIIAPTGTVDSGTVVTPACSVVNYGTASETYNVRMRIGAGYNQVVSVANHLAGTRRYVTFPNWTAGLRGMYAVSCSTQLAGDSSPSNDKKIDSVLVRVPDVGCRAFLVPSGAVDSGTTLTPACTVYNYGSGLASYNVRVRIGGSYNNTAAVVNHAAGTALYVTFPNWTANVPRGGYTATCSTELAGDVARGNDKRTNGITVRVLDAACVALLAPSGTVDSGTVVTPACSAANFGSQAATYTVRMKIGATYNQAVTVTAQTAGTRRYVTFPSWTATPIATHPVSCSTELAGDLVSANDRLTGSVTVRGRDVGCTRILAPPGTVDSGATVTPSCSVYNYSSSAVTYNVRMRVGPTYNQVVTVSNHPGQSRRYVTFPNWLADLARGGYAVSCSTEFSGDANPANDKQTGTVTVRVADVGCQNLLAPSGTVDSGVTAIPACTVYNHGSVTSSYNVRMRIGASYNNSVAVLNHPAGTARHVTFPAWTATGRGTNAVACSTALSGDLIEANNKLTGAVDVRVRDAGCLVLIAPRGAVDSGATVTPACTVANYGTTVETYNVRLRIGTGYDQAVAIVNQAAGVRQYVTFAGWTASARGTYAVTCSTELSGDFAPPNDRRRDSVMVRVRDVSCRALLAPTGAVDSGASVVPACTVVNNGSLAETYAVRMKIGTGYDQTATVASHAAGTTRYVTFPAWMPTVRGSNTVSCSTELSGDIETANDRQIGAVDVRVRDVGCLVLLAPLGSVDSGTTVTPACTVANYGTASETYSVRLRVGAGYDQAVTVTDHAAGTTLAVTFPGWSAGPRGIHAVRCSTMLASDRQPANDQLTGQVDVLVADVGCAAIVAPAGAVDTNEVVTPACTVANHGTTTVSYAVRMRIGATYNQTASVTDHAPGTRLELTFPDWVAWPRGMATVSCSTELATDLAPANDKLTGLVGVGVNDVAVVALLAPTGNVPLGAVVRPRALVQNVGSAPATFGVRFRVAPAYVSTRTVTNLARGETLTVEFDDWTAALPGSFATGCSTELAGDDNPANDRQTGSVRIHYLWPAGWDEMSSMPNPPSSKANADGSWLAFDQARGLIYAAKGNKSVDFYSYNPLRDSWATLAHVPMGTEAKPLSKGAAGCASGSGIVYATKGNNTLGFYKYVAARDSWCTLAPVPLGIGGKRVKGGTDLVYVPGSPDLVYLLKGYGNEFYRYDVAQDSWQALNPAPATKWDKGSWLAYAPVTRTGLGPQASGLKQDTESDEEPGTLSLKLEADDASGVVYAHQAKLHGFYPYDVGTDAWGPALPGMPFIGQLGRSKKSKDGGSATWLGSLVYALKGGATQEFWCFDPATATWAELETMPQFGRSGRKKKVKAGGDITATSASLLYALKGNKTNELWRYTPSVASGSSLVSSRSGAQTAATAAPDLKVLLAPNPLRSSLVTLRWEMTAMPGISDRVPSVSIYDASGRCVLRLASGIGRGASGVLLDLRSLAAGVYTVRLAAGCYSATQKLVVQR